ncbi:MAG: NUDIX hydrolase [Oscillospiraceae bacterium]|jgi:ADP-ribose pyrophosphatase|nr:NUDIX hydrolase [Oscillospiraceae bacterium]
MDYTERRVSGESVFTGGVFSARRDVAELHNGKLVTREVVEHSGGVVVVPVTDGRGVVMVRQYRYAVKEELLELPAGRLEPGEGHPEAARRELSEETGCEADGLRYLGAIYPSPGFCEETLHVYLATGLRSGETHPDEDEFLTVETVPLREIRNMIAKNQIKDAKTIAGIYMALLCMDDAAAAGEDGAVEQENTRR